MNWDSFAPVLQNVHQSRWMNDYQETLVENPLIVQLVQNGLLRMIGTISHNSWSIKNELITSIDNKSKNRLYWC